MSKPKSKLIANRSAHTVALSSDGVAARHNSSSKVKKAPVDTAQDMVPVPVPSRALRSARRPVDPLATSDPGSRPAAGPAGESVVAPPSQAKPRTVSKRSSTPSGPALSEATQARMREISDRLQALKQQLADLQSTKRAANAPRRLT